VPVFRYTGRSMWPALRTHDLIEVAEAGERGVRRGDVAVFRVAERPGIVVHRVLRAGRAGLVTRGDNAREPDEWLVRPCDVVGVAVAVRRGSRRVRLVGGRAGIAGAACARRAVRLERAVARAAAPVYHSSVLRRASLALCPPSLQPRVVVFGAAGAAVPRVLMGRRMIGEWDPRMRAWTIRRPYRPLIDEAALPRPENGDA